MDLYAQLKTWLDETQTEEPDKAPVLRLHSPQGPSIAVMWLDNLAITDDVEEAVRLLRSRAR